jgi:hypothetical protein
VVLTKRGVFGYLSYRNSGSVVYEEVSMIEIMERFKRGGGEEREGVRSEVK